MMVEYIDREQLLEHLQYLNNELPLVSEHDWGRAFGYDEVIEEIKKYPSEDVISRANMESTLAHLRQRCHPGAEKYFDENQWGLLHIVTAEDVQPVKRIPVTERLPDFEGMCLCMRKSYSNEKIRYQEIMYFDFDEQAFCSNVDGIFVADGNVTHWMPLPEPPKGW